MKKSKSIENQIIALEKKIKRLKKQRVKAHNQETTDVSSLFSHSLAERATKAELIFRDIAALKHISLEFQYPIYIYEGNEISKFYIADFCDVKHKIIFEIDGEYHFTKDQKYLDRSKDYWLRRAGYGVYRISNGEVFAGKSTAFLYNVYKNIGINILTKNN